MFECPHTCRLIDGGIQMDSDTLLAAGSVTLEVSCPYCNVIHKFPIRRGRPSDDFIPQAFVELEAPKLAVVTIAINALRISWLQRGI